MSEAELSTVAEEVRACRKCPLWKGRINAVPGEGRADAKLMVVGEAPGRNEDLEGRPFVGAAGKKLDALLAEAGLSRDEAFISNIVKCRPPKNRRPSKREADTCNQYLKRQMKSIASKVVVLLGDTALKQFFPAKSLSEDHGQRILMGGQRFFATYHPASVIYNPSLREVLVKDFQKLRELMLRATS